MYPPTHIKPKANSIKSIQHTVKKNLWNQIVTVKPLLPLEELEFLILDKKLVQDWSLLENKVGLTISENIILAQ